MCPTEVPGQDMIKLWACFVDDKRKFADVEFYFEEFTETYFWLI